MQPLLGGRRISWRAKIPFAVQFVHDEFANCKWPFERNTHLHLCLWGWEEPARLGKELAASKASDNLEVVSRVKEPEINGSPRILRRVDPFKLRAIFLGCRLDLFFFVRWNRSMRQPRNTRLRSKFFEVTFPVQVPPNFRKSKSCREHENFVPGALLVEFHASGEKEEIELESQGLEGCAGVAAPTHP